MRYQGRIVEWDEARGFGFIVWNGGNDKLFLHVSAFDDRSRRPANGDIVTYEATKDEKGRHRATRVAFAASSSRKSSGVRPSGSRKPGIWILAGILGAAAIAGVYVARQPRHAPPVEPAAMLQNVDRSRPAQPAFRCEGKKHCSQMTSCAEAMFYLENCLGSVTDGDGDGRPCEDQWCGH